MIKKRILLAAAILVWLVPLIWITLDRQTTSSLEQVTARYGQEMGTPIDLAQLKSNLATPPKLEELLIAWHKINTNSVLMPLMWSERGTNYVDDKLEIDPTKAYLWFGKDIQNDAAILHFKGDNVELVRYTKRGTWLTELKTANFIADQTAAMFIAIHAK